MNGQPQKLNVALFIDADNAQSRTFPRILDDLEAFGSVTISRAYGNWTKPCLSPWKKVLRDNAVQPMQQFDVAKGKNATDMAMVVDIMDVLFTKPVDVFCLISSDSDFTPLVMRLRAQGKTVVVYGDRYAAKPFVNACTKFVCLDDLVVEEAQEPSPQSSDKPQRQPQAPRIPKRSGAQLKGDTVLMNMLRTAIASASDKHGWAHLSGVGSKLGEKELFCHKHHGYSKLADMLAAIDLFEIRVTNEHPQVRLKKQAIPSLAA